MNEGMSKIVERAIRRVLGTSGIPEWEVWAEAWLSGADRTALSAQRMGRKTEGQEQRTLPNVVTWIAELAAFGNDARARQHAVLLAVRLAEPAKLAERERRSQHLSDIGYVIPVVATSRDFSPLDYIMERDAAILAQAEADERAAQAADLADCEEVTP